MLLEGLEIAHYVTLYDHPDKYVDVGKIKNDCIGNPLIHFSSEETRVFCSDSTHWKFTNSTTMTFASKVSTLIEDATEIMQFTQNKYPNDYMMFRHLLDNKKRTLISSIPGNSTHGETAYLSPLIDWSKEIV